MGDIIFVAANLFDEICVRGFGYLFGRSLSYLFGKRIYNWWINRRTPKRTVKWINQYFVDYLSDSKTAGQFNDYFIRWLQEHELSLDDLKSKSFKLKLSKIIKKTSPSQTIKNLLKNYKKPLNKVKTFQKWEELIDELLNSEFTDFFLPKKHTELDLQILKGIKHVIKESFLHTLKTEKVIIQTYLSIESQIKSSESQIISIMNEMESNLGDKLIDVIDEQEENRIILSTIKQLLSQHIKNEEEGLSIIEEIIIDIPTEHKRMFSEIQEVKEGIKILKEKAEEKPPPKEIIMETPFTFKHLSIPMSSSEELMKLEDKIEFLENRLRGKFIVQTGEKLLNWKNLKLENVLDFSWVEFPSIDNPDDPLYIITGKGGVGKTTYLFYWLEKCLSTKNSWIKNVIFLNPIIGRWNEGEIINELRIFTGDNPINSDNLIIAIDALFRENDDKKSLIRKFRFIKEIIRNDFKVILTIKNSHFDYLKGEIPISLHHWLYNLTPTIESTKIILENWMNFYKVKSSFSSESPELADAISLLFQKSEEGLPYYIHHFVIMLFIENLPFSKDIVEKVPIGMKNFIWYTIEKDLTIEGNPITYLILRALYKQRNSLPFSFEFQKFFTEWYTTKFSQNKAVEKALSKLNLLKIYLFDIPFERLTIKPQKSEEKASKKSYIVKYRLDDLWRDCFKSRYEDEDRLVKDFVSYKKFNDVKEFYKGTKSEFINYVRDFLTLNLKKKDNPENYPLFAFLLADLAKFDKNQILYCIELYLIYEDIIPWSYNSKTYIKHELALTSFLKAIEFRYEGDYVNAEKMIKAAIELVKFKKGLHFYSQILERKLRETPREQSEALISKIEDLYELIIIIDENDAISWNTKAIFCKNIQQFEKAEEFFIKALEISERKYVPTLQSYAIFCADRGNFYWNLDKEKAKEYFYKAEELFELGEEQAAKTKFSQRELLNAYAIFLGDLAGKKEDIELDKKADDKWKILINEYGDARDKNGYANFLMKIGRRLKHRYPGKSYLKIAKDLLQTNIEKNNDPYSYNILARLLYQHEQKKFKKYFDKEQIFIEALQLLELSIKKAPLNPLIKYPLFHETICNHEMAKTYMMWANFLEADERAQKLDLAITHLKTALEIPDVNQNYNHKMRVYYTFSILYSKYKNNIEVANYYALKADKYARKLQWKNRTYFRTLIKMGDDSSREDLKTAIYFYNRASKIQEDNYRSYMRIGHCYSNLALEENYEENIEKAIEYYTMAAECEGENLYFLRYIRENLQHDLQSKLGYYKYPSLLRYLKIMQMFSEKILIEGADISWKIGSDYINYSEDFMNVGRILAYKNAKESINWFNLARKQLPILQNKIKGLFEETRFGEETKTEMRDVIKKSHRIDNLCARWETELKHIIKANRRNQLHRYHKILKFDYETCIEFNNIVNAREILKEYLDVLFPLELLKNEDILNLGKKFLELHENTYAYKCFKYLEQTNTISINELVLLSESTMRIGYFKKALTLFKEILEKFDESGDRNYIYDMINRCELAITIKDKISEALTSIIELVLVEDPKTQDEFAVKFYNAAKNIMSIKEEINLIPLLSVISKRNVYFRESNNLKMIIFPNKIIRYLLWKANKLGYQLSEDEENFLNMADYKYDNANVLLYSAIQIRKEAFNAGDLLKDAKFIQAAFYHLAYLALDSIEIKRSDLELSRKWGQTGGALNSINQNSLIKISYSILKKCFHRSIYFNDANDSSRANYGMLILKRGNNIEGAKAIFNRCLKTDKNLLIGLGEIAELDGDQFSARDYYNNAADHVKILDIDNDYKVRELTHLAEKLISIGYPDDAPEIYEFIEKLVQGRKNLLVNIKINIIKNSIP